MTPQKAKQLWLMLRALDDRPKFFSCGWRQCVAKFQKQFLYFQKCTRRGYVSRYMSIENYYYYNKAAKVRGEKNEYTVP